MFTINCGSVLRRWTLKLLLRYCTIHQLHSTVLDSLPGYFLAGAASSKFKIGQAGADKKPDGTEEKLYCQVWMGLLTLLKNKFM